ncbi:hypothetical protein DERF_001039 [Dermatophagoides farinae]|uniref:Uncharacterized protein n=1 Tax=Dermatophagoides farinae TaxID=6954 RepID=A0A922I7U6_DERFA|nr:hypothetical protein DERF_001039 [Dermatophagoides farinae]
MKRMLCKVAGWKFIFHANVTAVFIGSPSRSSSFTGNRCPDNSASNLAYL